jgi:hypothetical protein
MLAIIVGFYTLMIQRLQERNRQTEDTFEKALASLIAYRSFKAFFILCSFMLGWSLLTMYLTGISFFTSQVLDFTILVSIVTAVFTLAALYVTVHDILRGTTA